MGDRITQEGIRGLLPEAHKARLCIEVLESIVSTNDYLKQTEPVKECTYRVVIAEEQTGGKGRRGKQFLSPRECGIYLSIQFQIQDAGASYAQELTALSAIAACRAIETHTNKQPLIKWPNDVYCDGKKVCGILCESQIEAYSGKPSSFIAGIGIDVYKPGISQIAAESIGYLAEAEEQGLRNRLIASLIEQLIALQIEGTEGAREEYRKRSMLLGRDIVLQYDDSRCIQAYVEDINDQLQLLVKNTDGSHDVLDMGNFSISF